MEGQGVAGVPNERKAEGPGETADFASIDFAWVEERLIEAWGFWRRYPLRGDHKLGIKASGIFREMTREWWDAGWQTDEGKRIEGWSRAGGLTADEVDRMEEALGWIEWVRPADRKLIGMALDGKSSAQGIAEWERIREKLVLSVTRQALSQRYDRAIGRITRKLVLQGAARKARTC